MLRGKRPNHTLSRNIIDDWSSIVVVVVVGGGGVVGVGVGVGVGVVDVVGVVGVVGGELLVSFFFLIVF